jgi:anti-sigma regulatory factor (Ser/Thr protein kinase)
MHLSLPLPAAPESPRLARQFVASHAAEWGYGHIADEVELLTSELVTNAVMHTGAPVEVEVADLADGVLVAVVDPDANAEPTPRSASPRDSTGRGLAIVDALAASWGVSRVPHVGKVVWCKVAARSVANARPR